MYDDEGATSSTYLYHYGGDFGHNLDFSPGDTLTVSAWFKTNSDVDVRLRPYFGRWECDCPGSTRNYDAEVSKAVNRPTLASGGIIKA